MEKHNNPPTCSRISLTRREPLLGTAPRVEVWLLLSYGGAFGAQAFEQSELPDPVKRYLTAALDRIPHARLLLIKPHPELAEGRIEFRVVSGREVDPFYVRFELSSYEQLLDVDIEGALDSEPSNRTLRKPFYLVCTNGRRDPCCSQYGLPVSQALRESAGAVVWECSHVGGHRFAANVLQFPHGIYYGRIRESQVGELLAAGRSGRLSLDHFRGRACYTPIAQAGEALLRRVISDDELAACQLLRAQQDSDNRWNVAFARSGDIHHLSIEVLITEEVDRVSCRGDKLAAVTTYQLKSHAVQSP